MSALDRLASALGRRDEVPNVELAEALAASRDEEGVQELVDALASGPAPVSADAIKVLYELGTRDPSLIAPYAAEFAALLSGRNNRLIWGATTALHEASKASPQAVAPHLRVLMDAVAHGSVITADRGIGAIANAAMGDEAAIDFVLDHLQTCGAKYVPLRAEHALPAVTTANAPRFLKALQARLAEQSAGGRARLKRLIRTIESKAVE
ncbi:MAG: hypothetical protein JW722_07205 [Demequinaceae bacterium]|nr:hypothetical protein [Demequinaceae bacterium]